LSRNGYTERIEKEEWARDTPSSLLNRQTPHAAGVLTPLRIIDVGSLPFRSQPNQCAQKHQKDRASSKRVLPLPKKMHQKVMRLRTLDEVEEVFPSFKAFLDATEQEIPRPKSKHKRKTHYSGKKKRHTVKTQITVNKCFIIHKTRQARRSTQDYARFKYNHPHLPRLNLWWGIRDIETKIWRKKVQQIKVTEAQGPYRDCLPWWSAEFSVWIYWWKRRQAGKKLFAHNEFCSI